MRTEEQFWSRVDRTNGCWLWQGAKSSNGYGRLQWNGRDAWAHRIAYCLSFDGIPDGLFVCHHCDTPLCVRPSHLFLGTRADNMQDALRKGRLRLHRWPSRFGAENPAAKLTAEAVAQIRSSYGRGDCTQMDLARRYGVSRALIGLICQKKIWPEQRLAELVGLPWPTESEALP